MDLNFHIFETATLSMTVLVVAALLQVGLISTNTLYYSYYRAKIMETIPTSSHSLLTYS